MTADNAAQQNDAAAACLVVAEDRLDALEAYADGLARRLGRRRLRARNHGYRTGTAVRRLFARTGLSFDAMDLVGLNETFAVQVLAVL